MAGVAVLAGIASRGDDCTPIDYHNYTGGKKMVASPATAMVDDKHNACVTKKATYIGDIADTDEYMISIKIGETQKPYIDDGRMQIDFATNVISAGDLVSGASRETYSVYIDDDGVVTGADSEISSVIGKKLFDVVSEIKVQDATFSKEIVYTGISGSILHLQYRSYNGTTIRWPYTVNLDFDLSKSDTVTVGPYRLHIVSADNNGIVYVVEE